MPFTLKALARAGFPSPRLFVDGDNDSRRWEAEFQLKTTCHNPAIYLHGNWFLALHELYIREPYADYYAIFQDDLTTYNNLRVFLEKSSLPEQGYFNLFTHPDYEKSCQRVKGWHPGTGKGLGALALVFPNPVAVLLLSSPTMIDRPKHYGDKGNGENNGWRNIDGGVVTAMKHAGITEYFHYPSLVQHTGTESTFNKRKDSNFGEGQVWIWKYGGQSPSFLHEDFDAMELL